MAKGDWVAVTYAVGDRAETVEIKSEANGRRIEIEPQTKWLICREVTRGGTTVRSASFKMESVVAFISNVAEE